MILVNVQLTIMGGVIITRWGEVKIKLWIDVMTLFNVQVTFRKGVNITRSGEGHKKTREVMILFNVTGGS